MMKFYLLLFVLPMAQLLAAQDIQRCASVERIEQKFAANPSFRSRFEKGRALFNQQLLQDRIYQQQNAVLAGELYTIPIVVHVVLTDPSVVTDISILNQLNILNEAFAGTSADSTGIPSYFKSLKGHSAIQFCLAQQTPAGLPSTGIERVKSTRASFSYNNEGVKHSSLGGANSWDNTRYLNIWITQLSGGLLGYSSFPEDEVADEQGVVIDYRSLPGGSFTAYNNGKSLVHETGHFFNLYHIWGDDDGACTGTDYVDDTPGQANSTATCTSGKVFDRCTSSGDGIMYQNYMDYTEDECLVFFTGGQVARMESAAITYFSSLINSNVCQLSNLPHNDVAIVNILQPGQRLCDPDFNILATIQNNGIDTLRSLSLIFSLNNGTADTIAWQGSLAYKQTAAVASGNFTIGAGAYSVEVYANEPNQLIDEEISDNILSTGFEFYENDTALSESFESAVFPPMKWSLIKNNSSGWERSTIASSGGIASALLTNASDAMPVRSMLRLPELQLQSIDSAWLSFQYTMTFDSLQVLISFDCGNSYNVLYTKTNLIAGVQSFYRDSVNLSAYIGQGNFMLAFLGVVSGGNRLMLDDINLRKIIVNPNLKNTGFLITPNPVSKTLNIQFYPQPSTLQGIYIYSITGQKKYEIRNGLESSLFPVNVSLWPAGVYIVSACFSDRQIVKRFIKVN